MRTLAQLALLGMAALTFCAPRPASAYDYSVPETLELEPMPLMEQYIDDNLPDKPFDRDRAIRFVRERKNIERNVMLETLSQGIFDEGLLNLNLAKTYLRRDLEDKEDYGEMLLAEVGDYVAEGEDLVMVHAETRYTLEDGYHTSQVELRVNSEEGSRSYWFNSEEGVLRMWGNTSKVEEARTHSGTIESLYAVSMSGVLPAIETWEPELDEKVAEMGE